MRIEQVTGFPIYLTHRFTNLFIRISRTRDIRCYGSMTVTVQCQYTGKITWISHIHCIGNSSYGRTRIVFSGLQVLVENIIPVIGCNKTLDRQAHAFTK